MKYILLHGMGQNASSWDKTISFLPESAETVCPELSDFFTKDNCFYNKMYAAFCDYCNNFSDPLNLCGLSLGAVLALNYAIDNPSKVGSLILIAPQYEMPKALLKFQNFIFKLMPNSTFENVGFNKQDFITLTSSMADMDFSEDLKRVVSPALILCGEKDKANKKAAKRLAEGLKYAELCFVPKSGHEVNVDEPKSLAEIISGFYENIYGI